MRKYICFILYCFLVLLLTGCSQPSIDPPADYYEKSDSVIVEQLVIKK